MSYIKNTEEVVVTSLVKHGKLVFKDSEGIVHTWDYFGEELELPFKDVKYMAQRHKGFFKNYLVKVPDEVAKQLKLRDYLLDDKIDVDRLDNVFNMKPEKFRELLIGSSDGMQQLVVDTAVDKMKKDELDSLKILRIIKEVTGKDVELIYSTLVDRDLGEE